MEGYAMPNVGGNLPAEAGADWPRKDNVRRGLERAGDTNRSDPAALMSDGSAFERIASGRRPFVPANLRQLT